MLPQTIGDVFLSGLCDRELYFVERGHNQSFLSGLCDREHDLCHQTLALAFLSGLCDRELLGFAQCRWVCVSERSMRP